MKTMTMARYLRVILMWVVAVLAVAVDCWYVEEGLLNPAELEMFVDELPDMDRVLGFRIVDGAPKPKTMAIGMFKKKWKFHRDLPPTPVFAYGTSKTTATVPGPTIEAFHGVDTYITWQNHLPPNHILQWDPTIPTAISSNKRGVPTVVHVHGGIDEPASDGHPSAWFTARFNETGPTWAKKTYHYHNDQQPGNLWYHDHAMGLTRVNLLAGLLGAYIIRDPSVEAPLGLPCGVEFDRPLIVFDRNFHANGSIYLNSTGNNPSVHPHWRPEYFGNVIIVNGKAWPITAVRRRKYRFRIINGSNARFFRFFFNNGLRFVYLASDSVYLRKPVVADRILLGPSEVADVVVDFSKSKNGSAILANDAPFPYPAGNLVSDFTGTIMKFVISDQPDLDTRRVPKTLIRYPPPVVSTAAPRRYITMLEYKSSIDEPTHLYLNGKPFDAEATWHHQVGSTELWYVINLTEDNHPFHIHLGFMMAIHQTELVKVSEFKSCMMEMNDAIMCGVEKHAVGRSIKVPAPEKGWKNVFKIRPGVVTKIAVKFGYIHSNASYPFDATRQPGYVYHCHILDHEDNEMMRPLKMIN